MQLGFKTILVATDFESASELAIEYARVLAHRFGAGLRVVHVVEPPLVVATEFGAPDVSELRERAVLNAEIRLAKALNAVAEGDVIGQVLIGQPAQAVVQYASDHDVDLIVMGTHGRGPVAHLLMGSVAERVVRTAPCPVFTVRESGALHDAVANRDAMVAC